MIILCLNYSNFHDRMLYSKYAYRGIFVSYMNTVHFERKVLDRMNPLSQTAPANAAAPPTDWAFHDKVEAPSYLQIESPFQITYEFCSGIGDDDYFNAFIISPDAVFSYFVTAKERLSYESSATMHCHDFFELMIVLEGEIVQIIENKEYLYPEGTCCLINRNLMHTEKTLGQTKLIFLGLSTKLALELIESPQNALFHVEKDMKRNPVFDFMTADLTTTTPTKAYIDFLPKINTSYKRRQLYALIEQIVNTFLFPDFGTSYLLKGQICQLINYLLEYCNSTYIELTSNTDFLLFSRTRYLIEASDGKISRKELSKTLHYSSGHIARTIKKYTGMCLYDYEMSYCLKKAAQLLSTTDYSVTTVMELLHFTNRTHFYKLFKERYGMVPGLYQKSEKNKPENHRASSTLSSAM